MLVFILTMQSNLFHVTIAADQLKFCSCASWNASLITEQDTIYTVDRENNRILLKNRTIYGNFTHSLSVFVADNEEIFVDNGYLNHRVDRWTLNENNSKPVMNVNSSCVDLFVDIKNNLYCSATEEHRILKVELNVGTIQPITVAGTGCPGPISNMLHYPHGIFIDIRLNLYVADTDNNRIQLFPVNQLNAITVAGFGSDADFLLNRPTDIAVDIDSSLFIVENLNHRIVRSTPTGFQCILGCSDGKNQLQNPQSMYFDAHGNIFIIDMNSNGLQKFVLAQNSCYVGLNSYFSTINNSSWIQTEGRIINSGIGGAGQIWAIDSSSQIFYKVHLNARWTRSDGYLSYISVGAAGHVFGVNIYDQIFYRENASNSNPKGSDWINIDGKVIQVAVTSTGGVWAVNRARNVFYRAGINENWGVIDGLLTHISVGVNGDVWGVNHEEKVFYREGSSNLNPRGNSWRYIVGHARHATVGGQGEVWVVNRLYEISLRLSVNTDWTHIAGNASFITVAPNGLVLANDMNGYIFYRENSIFC